jgi:membrane associated rhomboid family serine protease
MRLKIMPATAILVTLNIVVALMMFLPGFSDWAVPAGGVIPERFFAGDAVLGSAALQSAATTFPAIITPFTAPFIHNGLIDALIPSLMLLLMGSMNEKILGWQGVIVLFFGGAFASAIVYVIMMQGSIYALTGSYSAVSAVIAAYLLLYPVGKPMPWGSLPAEWARPLQLLLFWFIMNLALTLSISYEVLVTRVAAPMAGFAFGLLLARPLLLWKYRHA